VAGPKTLDKPIRPGEIRVTPSGAFLVPIIKRVVPSSGGTTDVELSLNLQEVPVPERRYVADIAWVVQRDETLRFMFAQANLTGVALRSLVVVTVFPETIRNLVKACEESPGEGAKGDLMPPLFAHLTDFMKHAKPQPLRPFSDEPSQTVALTGNLISISLSGREAEVDFFHIAPNVLRKVNHSNEVAVDPIVRIDLPTALLASVLNEVKALTPSLPDEIKK
jgi:hypothetical protein